MNYLDGRRIQIGDQVELGGGMAGIVVGCLEEGEFSAEFNGEDWKFLVKGVLVKSPEAGLIHYPDEEADLVLVKRASLSI
jgi:hypothetical protein